MKIFKYFLQFLVILSLLIIFKIVGQQNASFLGSYLAKIFGPLFRSKKIIDNNLKICFRKITQTEINKISLGMWDNIGRTFSEYVFLKKFKKNHNNLIKIHGTEYLDEIKKNNETVIFVTGHFSNFELIGTKLNAYGIKLGAIYRPLNNPFLNPILELLRLKYICPIMIKKGRSSMRELFTTIKKGYSIVMLVDQRISEGILVQLFNFPALTTTVPAQINLRLKCKIIPIHMERLSDISFEMTVYKPIEIKKSGNYDKDCHDLTLEINKKIEKMILKKPEQWLWSHNRWK